MIRGLGISHVFGFRLVFMLKQEDCRWLERDSLGIERIQTQELSVKSNAAEIEWCISRRRVRLFKKGGDQRDHNCCKLKQNKRTLLPCSLPPIMCPPQISSQLASSSQKFAQQVIRYNDIKEKKRFFAARLDISKHLPSQICRMYIMNLT